MGTREAPPIPPRPPKGNPTGYVPNAENIKKITEFVHNKEILESIANNIHADDMARVEACKALMGIG
jgi:bifunctional pyridoxal-dependent enzyme with beta-cystathionase and maltose regulon repressor activities